MARTKTLLLAAVAMLMLPASAIVYTDERAPETIAAEVLAPLVDPKKLVELRRDNQRLFRLLYWLEVARQSGGEPGKMIELAQQAAHYAGSPAAQADKEAILQALARLGELGCLTPENMGDLRKGRPPTITRGDAAGDVLVIDPILPRSVVPEVAGRHFNVELVPARSARPNEITAREIGIAQSWSRAGLLSADGLRALEAKTPAG